MHACCWSHSRRYFFEAAQLNPSDAVATRIVARINDLFAVDTEAREQEMDLAERHALRQSRATPLLAEIKAQIEAAQSTALPSSALAQACRYFLITPTTIEFA